MSINSRPRSYGDPGVNHARFYHAHTPCMPLQTHSSAIRITLPQSTLYRPTIIPADDKTRILELRLPFISHAPGNTCGRDGLSRPALDPPTKHALTCNDADDATTFVARMTPASRRAMDAAEKAR